MAMFDDPKKELKKLEAQLLKEEEWLDKELASAKKLLGDAPAKKTQKPAAAKTAQKPAAAKTGQKPAAAKKPLDQTQVYRTGADGQIRKVNSTAGAAKKPAPKPVEEPKPKEKGIKGLLILACLETLGIVGVVAYWLRFLL